MKRMTTPLDANAFHRAIDPILKLLPPERVRAIAAYQGDNALRERIEELAEKNAEGSLLQRERREYEGYVKANNFLAILQASARRALDAGTP